MNIVTLSLRCSSIFLDKFFFKRVFFLYFTYLQHCWSLQKCLGSSRPRGPANLRHSRRESGHRYIAGLNTRNKFILVRNTVWKIVHTMEELDMLNLKPIKKVFWNQYFHFFSFFSLEIGFTKCICQPGVCQHDIHLNGITVIGSMASCLAACSNLIRNFDLKVLNFYKHWKLLLTAFRTHAVLLLTHL